MMDSLFTQPAFKEPSSKTTAEADDDLFKIPFSATKLRHSLSEGGGKPLPKPGNGYHRMHSFHSTLSDDQWNEDDREFTDTIFKEFPGLSKNGFHSHSFDEDIFEEAADKFSCGFFSESEIDDIPRSSLFHRTGLRRSTSQVEPLQHPRKGYRRDPEQATQKSNEKSSRPPKEAENTSCLMISLSDCSGMQAKFDELKRLKKELEDLKASWQQTNGDHLDHQPEIKSSAAGQEKDKEETDLLESRLKVLKDKGKMKRRRLSSSRRSHSLSSKFMEELLEEDEGSAEVEAFDTEGKEKGKASSAVQGNGQRSLMSERSKQVGVNNQHSEIPTDFEHDNEEAFSSSGRQNTSENYASLNGQQCSSEEIGKGAYRSPSYDHQKDIGNSFSSRGRHIGCEEDDVTPSYRGNKFGRTWRRNKEDEDSKQLVDDLPSSFVRKNKFGDTSRLGRQLSDSLENGSPSVWHKSKVEKASIENKGQIGSQGEKGDGKLPSQTNDENPERYGSASRWSNRRGGKDCYGDDNDYAPPSNVEIDRSDASSVGKRGTTAEYSWLPSQSSWKNGYDDTSWSERDRLYKESNMDGVPARGYRSNLFDDMEGRSGRDSDSERKENHLSSSARWRNRDDITYKQQQGQRNGGLKDECDATLNFGRNKPFNASRGIGQDRDNGITPLPLDKRNTDSRSKSGKYLKNTSKEIGRESDGAVGHNSPSFDTRRNNTLIWKKKQRDSDYQPLTDEYNETSSGHVSEEAASVKRKPQSNPFISRKTSLELDDGFIESTPGQNFRRSFSTSFDVHGAGERRNPSRLGYGQPCTNSDENELPGVSSNFRRNPKDDEPERRDDIQQDTFSNSHHSKNDSLHQTATAGFTSSVDFKSKMDKSMDGSGIQFGRSHDRKSKHSWRHDRFGVDDIFEKFSIPKRDFFEDEFFARDWKRHQLMEEIGGIQRNLADITKRELGKRKKKRLTDEQGEEAGCESRWDAANVRLRRSPSEIDLQTERSNLTGLLKQLLCKKQEREQQIRQRIDQLKNEKQADVQEENDDACKSDEDGREKEENCKHANKTPTATTIVQGDDEDEVSFILRRAGADAFIPIVKKNEITIDQLYQLMPSDFEELGITDPDLQSRLQAEIDSHFVEQKNAQQKAAELEGPACVGKGNDEDDAERRKDLEASCSQISSAPEGYEPDVPVHVSAECVVCLDNQSNLLFLNCGHVCCCYDCAINLTLCPLCRAEIVSKLIMNDSLPDNVASTDGDFK